MYLEFEDILYGPEQSFASIRFEGTRINCPYHRHPEVELVCLERASGRFTVGDQSGSFSTGDIFLLGANLPHIFQVEPSTDGSPRSTHVIQFREDFVGTDFFSAPEMTPVCRLLRRAQRGLQLRKRMIEPSRKAMQRVHTATGARRLIALLELLADLAEGNHFTPLASPGYDVESEPTDPRMVRILAHIHEHLTEPLSVPAVAKIAGLTPNAFCRYFRSRAHRTFTDFVNELRVQEAGRLLRSTEAPVTEIAYACGFGNLAHFYKEFQKRRGTTPRTFRDGI
jgi:AraC-like DNA-binding protein